MPNQSVQTQPRNMTSRVTMIPKQNKSRRFQVQWDPTQSGGQMVPEQFQDYTSQTRDQNFMQMQYQKSSSQWANQEGQMGPTQSGGQMASTYYQNYSSQLRDKKKIMQMQYPINPSQWKRHESLQFRSQDFSKYPQMRGQVNHSQIQYARNPSQWGRQDDMQYRNQADSEYLQMRGQMNPNQLQYARNPYQLGHQGPQFQSQSDPEYSQMQHQTSSFQFEQKVDPQFRSQNNNQVYFRQDNVERFRADRSTQWNDWVPPHLLTKSQKTTRGTDSPKWEGWTGSHAGTFLPGWHPNHPRYNFNASVKAV